jgi:L-arabinose transport system ATP-binding protein
MTLESSSSAQAAGRQAPAQAPLLQLKNIGKQFPGVRALEEIDLEVFPGEVLALVGENGAGKSTLLRVINGDYTPDTGEVLFRGERVALASPADSHARGVRVIYQEPEIVADVTVAENIFIGELPRRFGRMVDWQQLKREAQRHLVELGVQEEIDPLQKANRLSAAQRQMVEIARAIKAEVSLLALDEPTSSLSDEDANRLFKIVERFRSRGAAIIYVSHRLREVLQLADRIAVLRDGRLVTVQPAAAMTESDLVRYMVGRNIGNMYGEKARQRKELVLEVENLCAPGIDNVSFQVHRGEVVGFAGLVGAGRTDLAKTLFGERPIRSGHVRLRGQEVRLKTAEDAIRQGIGFTPEDRKREALVLDRSVKDNISLVILRRISSLRFVRRRKEQQIVQGLVARLRVKTPSIDQKVRKLSGGNQQKVVLARWLARDPDVLILDEPTRGVDVGAKSEIYRLIDELACQGMGVIFISSELPEILGVSDRIVVMQGGRVTGELAAEDATEESVLRLAMAKQLEQQVQVEQETLS